MRAAFPARSLARLSLASLSVAGLALAAGCPSPTPSTPTTMPRTTPATTWPPLDEKLLADAAATFNFRLGKPAVLAVLRDGAVLFRRTPPRGFASDLYELAPDGTTKTLARADELLGAGDEQLSDAEKARRERMRTATRGVVDAEGSQDGKLVMVPLGGKFHVIERATGKRTTVDPKGAAFDPHLAPDGSAIAFVRDGDLWVIAVAGGATARQLTKHPDGFEFATADFAAQEELDRTRGFWWSPDSKTILFQRSDLRPVDTLYVSDPRHPDRPPVPFRYPRAGTKNAIIDLGVIDVAATTAVTPRWITWDVTKFSYLSDVVWPPRGVPTIVVLDRDQNNVAVMALDIKAATARTLFEEHDDAWINMPPGTPHWLDDGSGFLWMTESRGDAWTLELRHPDGTLAKTLTQPELGLSGLAGSEPGAAIVTASQDPTLQDVYRIKFDGSPPEKLTESSGVASASAKHGVIIIGTAHAAGGSETTIVRGSGRQLLPSVAERPSLVPTTVIEHVEIGGRRHYVSITRPRAFDPGKRYPVLLHVYGGPHAQMVQAMRDGYVMDQWYADAGFIVVRSDGRGTPHRGRAWERAILKDLITIPLDDQVAAVQAMAARHRELDLGRVGVFGWSFGGYFATMAALLRPDVFKAAIAGAPVTDWALYDTAYTERYMKTPQANPVGYRTGSAVEHAGKLTVPLLIIHGITDDNVHFAHTLALIEALYVAGKRAELITLSSTHMVPDPKLNLAREKVQIDFFRDHL